MTEHERLVAQLIDHEGLRLRPYVDTVGKLTIGVGRNLTDKGLSKPEALHLLENDIHECIADLASAPWLERLDAVRQRAMLDLRFNLGPTRFRLFKQMLRALDDLRYGDAADALLASKWATQVQPARRDRLVRMLRTGIDA
jgi:lysozyme